MATYNGNSLTGNEIFRSNDIINFDYIGVGKPITLPAGKYKFECWGASASTVMAQGRGDGAYCKGLLTTKDPQTFYAYAGARGNFDTAMGLLTFGGGGENHNTTTAYSKGGGASDIRLVSGNWDNIAGLRSRIMVAAGAASRGNNDGTTIPHAGDLVGMVGSSRIAAANQTSGFAFGYARGGYSSQSWTGGGGGYYGGNTTSNAPMAAGSGSSFISGHPGCNAIRDGSSTVHTGQPNHYSGFVFTETQMLNGSQTMPDPRGVGNRVGNLGHGFVRITIISIAYILLIDSNGDVFGQDPLNATLVNLNKDEASLTRVDFETYGIFPGDELLTKQHMVSLGTPVDILKLSVGNELAMSILPYDQIIKPISSINLSLAHQIKKITSNDVGNIQRLFSVDNGVTWESFVDGQRTHVEITGDYEQDAESMRQFGMSSATLLSLGNEEWNDVFPPEQKIKEVMFLMLVGGNNKSYSINVLQGRYGYYQDMLMGTEWISKQYVDNLNIKIKRAVPTEVKIVIQI